jgi:hypothetical protein
MAVILETSQSLDEEYQIVFWNFHLKILLEESGVSGSGL